MVRGLVINSNFKEKEYWRSLNKFKFKMVMLLTRKKMRQ